LKTRPPDKLSENRPFVTEKEWTWIKLAALNEDTIADLSGEDLHTRIEGVIELGRCRNLTSIARLARLPGVGTLTAQWLVRGGIGDVDTLRATAAETVCAQVNTALGYPVWGDEVVRQIAVLQSKIGA